MRFKRIIFVAFVVWLLAIPAGSARASEHHALTVAGYQRVDDTVVVGVHNPGDSTEQGVVRLEVRLRGSSFTSVTAVSVPAGATVPVAFEIPREWSGAALRTQLKIHVRVATDGTKGQRGEGAPGDRGGSAHSEGNQITEGPDTVGG